MLFCWRSLLWLLYSTASDAQNCLAGDKYFKRSPLQKVEFNGHTYIKVRGQVTLESNSEKCVHLLMICTWFLRTIIELLIGISRYYSAQAMKSSRKKVGKRRVKSRISLLQWHRTYSCLNLCLQRCYVIKASLTELTFLGANRSQCQV